MQMWASRELCDCSFHPKFGDFTSDFTSNPGRRRFGSLIRAWRELLVGVSRYEWIRNNSWLERGVWRSYGLSMFMCIHWNHVMYFSMHVHMSSHIKIFSIMSHLLLYCYPLLFCFLFQICGYVELQHTWFSTASWYWRSCNWIENRISASVNFIFIEWLETSMILLHQPFTQFLLSIHP